MSTGISGSNTVFSFSISWSVSASSSAWSAGPRAFRALSAASSISDQAKKVLGLAQGVDEGVGLLEGVI